MFTRILNGFLNLVFKPSKTKFIGLFVALIFLCVLFKSNKENPNIIKYFGFYMIIPAFLFLIGRDEKKFISSDDNKIISQKHDYNTHDYNTHDYNQNHEIEIVDRLEKRTIITSKTEIIETVYFRNGVEHKKIEKYKFD